MGRKKEMGEISMPTIKTDFVISGEKRYKDAISEINRGLGVLDSEMKKVTAQYQDNANGIEALTQKGAVLERKLISQKEKVEKLREALVHAVESYGEGSKTAMEYQKSLNLAEAAVANTEHAIRENNKALEEAENGMRTAGAASEELSEVLERQREEMEETGEESEGLSLNIQDLAGQFGIQLPGGLDKALGSMKGFSAGAVAAVGAVAVAVAALVKAEKELVDLTREAAAKADDILTLSQITGLNTGTIQEMQYAADLIDVSFDTIKSSMTKLKNNMQDARNGNEKLTETFRTLGVEITNADGSLRDSEAVFYDVIDALGNIENATERDTIAMDVFGKKAEDLNPLILAGSDTLRKYADEAHNANYVLNGESLEALAAVDDAYQRMQKTQESVRNQIAAEMAPDVESFYESWSKLMEEAGKALIDSGIIDGLGEILKAVSGLIDGVGEIIGVTLPGAEEGLKNIHPVLSTIGALLASMADAIDVIKSLNLRGLISGDLGNALGFGYGSGNPNHYQTWRMQQEGTYDQYQSYYQQKWESESTQNRQTYSDGSSGNFSALPSSAPSDNSFYDPKTGKWYDRDTGWELPGYATGVMHFAGGRITVGENGPETVDLPEGSRIWNAQDSRMGAGGSINIYGDIVLEASKVEDLVDAARFLGDLRVMKRMR